uniref:DNA polymerase epsilon catalytic subunit n=1 Tax=Heterorhabditis bacteriophora TaxID=37862 RepID=A0A1I7WRX4_HETBA
MVEAFHNNIVFPNKFTGGDELKMSKDGHRLHAIESETYVGGHVEALEAGVFRADIPCRFRLVPSALARLRNEVPVTLEKELIREFGIPLKNVLDFDERVNICTLCTEVQTAFNELLKMPSRLENPRIYHLDVGAMYPNIILTNRLQPCAIVDEEICMACSFNTPDAKCKRFMDWEWRGELTPATRGEYQQIMQQLEGETFGKPPKAFHQLEKAERQAIEKKRVQDRNTHSVVLKDCCVQWLGMAGRSLLVHRERKRSHHNLLVVIYLSSERDLYITSYMLMYDYKELLKKAKGSLWKWQGLYAILVQILLGKQENLLSRLESRSSLILMVNISFLFFSFRFCITVSYPGAMLNALVHAAFTNEQYHNLQPDGSYTISKENSIFFEVDGPYRCMVLPASKEEGKKLKKRYAVFNIDGSLAELKGFEVKRRGELNIIKHFQSSVFKAFLRGGSLDEVYVNVAREADYWLDVLFSRGVDLSDTELFELISENRSMSRKLDEYGAQKSTSISTARRLAEFLGTDMVKVNKLIFSCSTICIFKINAFDAGLACQFVISRFPIGAPVTDRAIPVAIFQAELKVTAHYLRLWTKQQALSADSVNIRDPKITDLFEKVRDKPASDVNENGKRAHTPDLEQVEQSSDNENEPKKIRITDHETHVSPLEKKTLIEHGFYEWLNFLKKKWREEKKPTELIRILSVEETRVQGYYNLWVAVDGQMSKFTLRVPRTIVVNEKVFYQRYLQNNVVLMAIYVTEIHRRKGSILTCGNDSNSILLQVLSAVSFFSPRNMRIILPFIFRKDQILQLCSVRSVIKFNVQQFRSLLEAEKYVNKALRISREATTRPTILCMLSDEEPDSMVRSAKASNFSFFKCITIIINSIGSFLFF